MVLREAEVYYNDQLAGRLWETDNPSYVFQYSTKYLEGTNPNPLSISLPLDYEQNESDYLHPFFDGLIPEGFLMKIAIELQLSKPLDRFGLLLATGGNTIGAVSIKPFLIEQEDFSE
jgi:serine/threonine-protein kinase HipA